MKSKNKFRLLIALVIILVLISACTHDENGTNNGNDPKEYKIKSIYTIRESGGRVSWSHSNNLIAFDCTNSDGYAGVYLMQPDGSNETCLTCGKEEVPQMNNGNPEWHPSGDYIVFQAQDPDLSKPPNTPDNIYRYLTSPGVGINNNIWIMTADGSKFWQLTHVKDLHGALHPHFSRDGAKLVWSELIEPIKGIGQWEIKIADFIISNGIPTLKNIQSIKPLNLQLFELDDFTLDNKKILFSGSPQGGYYYDLEKYIYNLETGQTTKLTNNNEWDEQAHFINNDLQFVWVSSIDNPQLKPENLLGTIKNPPLLDYWIMNSDGTGLKRITGFNDPTSEDYITSEGGIGLGDFAISEDGKTIIGKMRRDRQDIIIIIEFE
jgi:Tol biopolymer transport system component